MWLFFVDLEPNVTRAVPGSSRLAAGDFGEVEGNRAGVTDRLGDEEADGASGVDVYSLCLRATRTLETPDIDGVDIADGSV